MIAAYGVVAVTFMMSMYALEHRGPGFVLAFAGGCLLSSTYGFLSGAWPFGVVELIWTGVAFRRYQAMPINPGRRRREDPPDATREAHRPSGGPGDPAS